MSDGNIRPVLAGQKALVIGVANDQSIAYGCAKAFRTVGAEVAITWLNEREPGHRYVERLAGSGTRGRRSPARSTSSVPGQLETVFDRIRADWGMGSELQDIDAPERTLQLLAAASAMKFKIWKLNLFLKMDRAGVIDSCSSCRCGAFL